MCCQRAWAVMIIARLLKECNINHSIKTGIGILKRFEVYL